jgi:hypothetical protein
VERDLDYICIGATPSYSTGGVNQMWILQEIYKDLLRVHIIKVPLHLYFKLIVRKIGKPNNWVLKSKPYTNASNMGIK